MLHLSALQLVHVVAPKGVSSKVHIIYRKSSNSQVDAMRRIDFMNSLYKTDISVI